MPCRSRALQGETWLRAPGPPADQSPDLQAHPHRAFTQLKRVARPARHDPNPSQDRFSWRSRETRINCRIVYRLSYGDAAAVLFQPSSATATLIALRTLNSVHYSVTARLLPIARAGRDTADAVPRHHNRRITRRPPHISRHAAPASETTRRSLGLQYYCSGRGECSPQGVPGADGADRAGALEGHRCVDGFRGPAVFGGLIE